jgi:hypothetical protein
MILDLPELPIHKVYKGTITPEEVVLFKLYHNETINDSEIKILRECLDFYKRCFCKLEKLNLSELNISLETLLKEYLNNVFSVAHLSCRYISFEYLFRVSIIHDDFLESNKVRDTKYLTYPSKELIKEKNIYNRANTPNSTVLYASFEQPVAIMETKPKIDERIIISRWCNLSNRQFNSYVIPNVDTISNRHLLETASSFKNRKQDMHPLGFEILDTLLSFIGNQFVKDIKCQSKQRFEYFYSAFFTEQVLRDEPLPNWEFIDCITYPSVACNHTRENIAIHPKSVENLKIIDAVEMRITSINFDNTFEWEKIPVKYDILRRSSQIIDKKIIWNDD